MTFPEDIQQKIINLVQGLEHATVSLFYTNYFYMFEIIVRLFVPAMVYNMTTLIRDNYTQYWRQSGQVDYFLLDKLTAQQDMKRQQHKES
jgi:hypothetical protein